MYGTSSKNGELIFDAYNNIEGIKDILDEIKPDAVVNCIGVLNQVAEDNHTLAVKLNSLLPHYLDMLSSEYNFKFVHVSTDCVYEGTKGKYSELDLPDATSFYGRSKALGEVKNDRNVTLRTSIVGPDNNPKGVGLFEWFIKQNDTCGGYTKVIWTGVTTIELAKAILVAIEKNVTGLNHVVNNDFISKHDLLVLFKNAFDKKIEITENDSVVSEKTLVKTNDSYDFQVPSYEQMINEMKDWVLDHKDLYQIIMDNCELGSVRK